MLTRHHTGNTPSAPQIALTTLVASAMLLSASAAYAGPEQLCQNGRLAAAGKYNACEQKAAGKYVEREDFEKLQSALAKCRVKYAGTWARLQAKASGTGATCDAARFVDNGNGTVTDNLTGLQWEQKTADNASVHYGYNTYSWSAGGAGFAAADGTAFTSFLAILNGGTCFAGHCDWRLPTRTASVDTSKPANG